MGKINFKELIDKAKEWYNNYPMEGIEISEANYKYVKTGKNGIPVAKEMVILEEMKNNRVKNSGAILNFSTSYIHYHFFELDNKLEDREAEKKMLFWKLKNKVPYLKEEEIFYDFYKIDEKNCLLFTLDREVYEGLKIYLPEENDYIINTEIMGIYNYYVWLMNTKKEARCENVILINMGETITDLLFVEDCKLKFIRSFEIGVKDYSKNIKESFDNIVDVFSYMFTNTYIPQDIEELLDTTKLENFNKIKDVNKNWMKEIDDSIKFYIPEEKRGNYKAVFMRYENYINNLDFVLSNYINMPVTKIDISKKEIPYISIIGNILKNFK